MDILDLFGTRRMLIVDVLNLIFRGLHGYLHLNQDSKPPVSHIYGPFNILMSQKAKFEGAEIHFVMDGYPKHRYHAFPGYKGGRSKSEEETKLVQETINALRMVPSAWYDHPDAEADDIAATLVSENENTEIRVISSDKDLWAFISGRVSIISNKSEVFTKQRVMERLGVPPEKVPLYKIFFGDDSDKVPPVAPRIRKDRLIPARWRAQSQ